MAQTESRQRRRLLNPHQLITPAYMIAIVVVLVGAWEGLKVVGRSSDYQLELGPASIGLGVARDFNTPHLQDIFGAFFKPAQRNGPDLGEVLFGSVDFNRDMSVSVGIWPPSIKTENSWVKFGAAAFTFKEAALGFAIGTTLGLLLAVVFVHSGILSRGLMPFVVASQTVPILAIAPMVVIWAAKANISVLGVPLIAAYLAFFPVTIYALRGLSDVPQSALELMESYAASRRKILFKLRIPNALPYIFTALKITGPASVVGAVIGELPSGIQEGLGGAILNFAQYYTSNPPQLWATNVATALVGIFFFVIIAVTERLVVRWKANDTN